MQFITEFFDRKPDNYSSLLSWLQNMDQFKSHRAYRYRAYAMVSANQMIVF